MDLSRSDFAVYAIEALLFSTFATHSGDSMSGMLNVRAFLGLCLLASVSLHASSADTEPNAGIATLARSKALLIAQEAAHKHGYNLDNHVLSTFGADLPEDRKEWLFNYECKNSRAPGCEFLVVVDRGSGDAKVYPGE